MVRDRFEDLGGSPSKIKDGIMKLGGKGFLLFAELQPETPGRLVAHAYAYEAMEYAGYAILIYLAQQAGDLETAELARSIQSEERLMMERLEKVSKRLKKLPTAIRPQRNFRIRCASTSRKPML